MYTVLLLTITGGELLRTQCQSLHGLDCWTRLFDWTGGWD